jgi:heme exporter protein CcmD
LRVNHLVRHEQETNVTGYLAMGGYGAYVWSAFAIALLLMVGLFVQSRQAARKREAELEALRLQVRPARARATRQMRPRREVEPAATSVPEGG